MYNKSFHLKEILSAKNKSKATSVTHTPASVSSLVGDSPPPPPPPFLRLFTFC